MTILLSYPFTQILAYLCRLCRQGSRFWYRKHFGFHLYSELYWPIMWHIAGQTVNGDVCTEDTVYYWPRYLLSKYPLATLECLKQWLLLPEDWHKIYLSWPAKEKYTPSPALPKRTNCTTFNQKKNNSTLFLFWPPLFSETSIESLAIHFDQVQTTFQHFKSSWQVQHPPKWLPLAWSQAAGMWWGCCVHQSQSDQ